MYFRLQNTVIFNTLQILSQQTNTECQAEKVSEAVEFKWTYHGISFSTRSSIS
jgi:hypothetical protein